MGCVCAGTEADLGTIYSTLMEDANGNYINIAYKPGAGTTYVNSSSRIDHVDDVRGGPAYVFNYSPATNELLSINSALGFGATYTAQTAVQNITAPTSSGANLGNVNVLLNFTGSPGYQTNFIYDTGAELIQAQFPTGGRIRWDYRTWDYRARRRGMCGRCGRWRTGTWR